MFRDVEALRQAGVPVAYDSEAKRYSIPGEYFLTPTNLTAEEALALLFVCRELADKKSLPLLSAAQSAASKIESTLPASLRESIREASRPLSHKPMPVGSHDDQASLYSELLAASVNRLNVEIDYESLTEYERVTTTLRPYRLMFHNHCWYVIGRSSLHRSVRTFNLRRIKSLKTLDKKFPSPRGFSLEQYLGNAWRIIPEAGPDQVVHLRFAPLVARNVAEVLWHPTQRCEFTENGSLDFYATVSGVNEIVWWVLGYGDQVEALKPLKLRKLVAQRLENAARQYRHA
ncbi:hypothetical protein Mal64_24550 [Pseudobythopirellula maris]|uniref:Uncharacterized protein n=1 Tax=Pseudobythopirellula maris TaxID=2527991 RepID=A0A5C5ZN79_9BACT|nr:hypothetical protein Mal64_24550 [Pseudobythopirellula maris]